MATDGSSGSTDEPTGGSADDGRGPAARARAAATTAAHRTAQLGLLAVGVVFGVFAVANRQMVSFSWLVGETEVVTTQAGDRVSGGAPLILLLLAAFLLGLLGGRLWGAVAGRSKRRDRG